jgi:hypothetical protein
MPSSSASFLMRDESDGESFEIEYDTARGIVRKKPIQSPFQKRIYTAHYASFFF